MAKDNSSRRSVEKEKDEALDSQAEACGTQTPTQDIKQVARQAFAAVSTLADAAEKVEGLPEDVSKTARRLAKRMEGVFGRVIIWEEMGK